VICTNYSGNTDFCTRETAFLVDGPLVHVRPGEYPFAEGQYWCEPDIGLASESMVRCFENPTLAQELGLSGQRLIRNRYSPETVGENYRTRLSKLGLIKGRAEA